MSLTLVIFLLNASTSICIAFDVCAVLMIAACVAFLSNDFFAILSYYD